MVQQRNNNWQYRDISGTLLDHPYIKHYNNTITNSVKQEALNIWLFH